MISKRAGSASVVWNRPKNGQKCLLMMVMGEEEVDATQAVFEDAARKAKESESNG